MEHEKPPLIGGLVLNRRVGEAFYIVVNGESVLVQVRERIGNNIRIAIMADRKKVAVVRYELTREK